jgi:ankyrin repeat protein
MGASAIAIGTRLRSIILAEPYANILVDSGVVRVLVGLGADVEAADMSGMRPLHLAAMRGHDDIARFLLRTGAHVNAQDSLEDK